MELSPDDLIIGKVVMHKGSMATVISGGARPRIAYKRTGEVYDVDCGELRIPSASYDTPSKTTVGESSVADADSSCSTLMPTPDDPGNVTVMTESEFQALIEMLPYLFRLRRHKRFFVIYNDVLNMVAKTNITK